MVKRRGVMRLSRYQPPISMPCQDALAAYRSTMFTVAAVLFARYQSIKPRHAVARSCVLEDGTPALPDKGWDYNPSDRLAGVNKALMDKRGKSSHVLLQALVDKLKKIPEFDIISGMDTLQKDYEKWAKQVLQPDYKARHEFRQVGVA